MGRAGTYDMAVLADRPWAYWPLGDYSQEMSGNSRGLNGTGVGITWHERPVASALGRTTLISGSNPYFGLANNDAGMFSAGASFTVELWVRPSAWVNNSAADYNCCFNSWYSTQDRFQVHLTAAGSLRTDTANGSSNQETIGLVSNPDVVGNRAVHAVVVSYGNVFQGWLNGLGGALLNSNSATRPTTATSMMRLGQPADGFWGNLQGYYCNVALYRYPLSAARILHHWRLGHSRQQVTTMPRQHFRRTA